MTAKGRAQEARWADYENQLDLYIAGQISLDEWIDYVEAFNSERAEENR